MKLFQYIFKNGKNAASLHRCSADSECLYPEELTTTVLSQT